MIAHIRKTDGSPQPLVQHCFQVSRLCEQEATLLDLQKTALLLGLLHDMGKATAAFQTYLLASWNTADLPPSPHPHALTGAIFVYRRWFCRPNSSSMERLTAQILALCIHGHHAGLADCLDTQGASAFLSAMQQEDAPFHYTDAVSWFCANIASEAELDALFSEACAEIETFYRAKIPHGKGSDVLHFYIGMLTRLLLSILVDADRWDSACFEYGQTPTDTQSDHPDWDRLLDTFETFREQNLNGSDEISCIRAGISDQCFLQAENAPGIYELCVPTGGGKTYSSLRYALRHAARYGKRRIFYCIPYNTILDQNAQDIRLALCNYPSILEHHSNVVKETEAEQDAYRRLTERWDSDIILTSLVQFLNACFAAPNTDARRLHRLSNAVLIFDEIQSLPKHCKTLFEQAISFLSVCCGSTILLCTATQPQLSLTPEPKKLVENCEELFQRMKRVEYVPQIQPPLSNMEAAIRLAQLLEDQSVLTIVNTKAVAWNVYSETVRLLSEAGMHPLTADVTCTEEQIRTRARQSSPQDILCVHLSTLLCPAHRKQLIQWIKLWLREKARVFCISTALIEAGINVSFPVVVRSLAGLPSIVQAAGRANRNMEYETGMVYLWKFYEEKLSHLSDIKDGGIITCSILEKFDPALLDMPTQIHTYFSLESNYTDSCKDYPLPHSPTLYSLLSDNKVCRTAAENFKSTKPLILRQSFRKAYQSFEAIPQATVSVLVPFGAGRALIEQLNGEHTMHEEILLLREAQAYSVSLYEHTFQHLKAEGAIWTPGNSGVLALEEGFYDETGGVQMQPQELDLIYYF